MRHYYIGIAFVLSSLNLFAQSGQLENSGFESWNNAVIYETPAQWFSSNQFNFGIDPTVLKSTDAQIGSYSAECRSIGADGFSYIGLGVLADEPNGGIPYTSDITSVKFMYKSDFQTGDSLYVYIIRYLGGTMVGEYVGGAGYNTHTTWTEGTFTIPAGTQDQLFIAFLTGSPSVGENNSDNSWFRIDNVRTFNGVIQGPALPNFSLENWTSVSAEEPDNWYTLNVAAEATGVETTLKSTDAHSGTYAAELKTLYSQSFDDVIPGLLSLTSVSGDLSMTGIPYIATPTSFSGWYKFSPSATGNDDPNVNVTFFKNGMIVSGNNLTFDPAATYTEFTLVTDLSEQPDSVNVVFFSGENEGATLKVDDIAFSGGTVGLDKFAKSNLSVYPNPATDKVMIKAEGNYSYEILTVAGTVVLNGATTSGAREINLEGLNAGTYFIRLNGNSFNGMHKLVVQ